MKRIPLRHAARQPRVRPTTRVTATTKTRLPRFSLRWLIILMTGGAILFAASVALPPVAGEFVLRLSLQGTFVVLLFGAIYGRGNFGTFCIGGLVAAAYEILPELFGSSVASDEAMLVFTRIFLGSTPQSGQLPTLPAQLPAATRLVELWIAVATLGSLGIWVRKLLQDRPNRPG